MKTQVCITADIEFDIAGAFSEPGRRRPIGTESVACRIAGNDEGLGFLLRTLSEFDLRAVFFIETLNTCYFGDDPMGEIAHRIQREGHDLQLHLHPCWTYFRTNGWDQAQSPIVANDSMAACSDDELRDLITKGLAAFDRWGLPRPVAVRAGNLQVDRRVYPIMKSLGLPIGSHIGRGIFEPTDSGLHLNGGRHWVDDVLEVPVTSYPDMRFGSFKRWKLLTVIGTSAAEMQKVMLAAAEDELSPIVLLTHATEFVTKMSQDYSDLKPNHLARGRLVRLCRFLRDNADQFAVTTYRDESENWVGAPASHNPELRVSPMTVCARILENRLSSVFSSSYRP